MELRKNVGGFGGMHEDAVDHGPVHRSRLKNCPQMTAFERSVHRAQITKVSMARETTAQTGW